MAAVGLLPAEDAIVILLPLADGLGLIGSVIVISLSFSLIDTSMSLLAFC